MWERHERKTLFTLNVDHYASAITDLTYPLLRAWARRMGADFYIISERQFPAWPVPYEKLQIYELAQVQQNDWNIFIDSDALVHPDTPDFTTMLPRDTVAHHWVDMAAIRWTYDRFFRRDGRHIGSGNWLSIASDWCIELWKPLDDLTLQDALERIQPAEFERAAGIAPDHLLDDYVLSRNIAQYGLKFTTVKHLQEQHGCPGEFFRHEYLKPTPEKVQVLTQTLKDWKLL
jgi:hypothetical protein